jgi:hypothetical protein
VVELQADEIKTIIGSKEAPIWIFAVIEVWSRLWPSTVVGKREASPTVEIRTGSQNTSAAGGLTKRALTLREIFSSKLLLWRRRMSYSRSPSVSIAAWRMPSGGLATLDDGSTHILLNGTRFRCNPHGVTWSR